MAKELKGYKEKHIKTQKLFLGFILK